MSSNPYITSAKDNSHHSRGACRFLDFTESANDAQALSQLADACEPAKFGKGTETVLDETYRKAGKMDPENFKTGLDVDACGLVDTVQTGLLPEKKLRDIKAELYKLNVYGEHWRFDSSMRLMYSSHLLPDHHNR